MREKDFRNTVNGNYEVLKGHDERMIPFKATAERRSGMVGHQFEVVHQV